jgi:decaprenylphospho-beta-D-erythro-pentofuranosid-2-ulose 2-reductase
MKYVAIFGASSILAREIAAELARHGFGLVLAGRERDETEAVAADIQLRYGVPAHAVPFDAVEFETHGRSWEECRMIAVDSLAGVFVCFGYLGSQAEAEKNAAEARRIIDVNLTGATTILLWAANYFSGKQSGFICAISSVAGDRGRQSNYFYGAAKAGLTAFLQGLRNRLHRKGVTVTTVKPGFMDTQMTYGRPGMFLVGSPAASARRIVRATLRGKHEVYVPGFWRWIMLIIRAMPETVFKRMRL